MKRPIIVFSAAVALLVACLAFAFAQDAAQAPLEDAATPVEPQANPIAMTQAPTDTDCYNRWQESQSRSFCSISDYSATSEGKCNLDLSCGNGYDTDVDWTGWYNNVKKLHWCHPSNQAYGFLKVGSC